MPSDAEGVVVFELLTTSLVYKTRQRQAIGRNKVWHYTDDPSTFILVVLQLLKAAGW